MTLQFQPGLEERHRKAAAALYDEAFGQKFSVAIRSATDRQAIIETSLDGRFAITATESDKLVGLAGFHTSGGSLTGGMTAGSLVSHLGLFRGLRAIALFSLYERKPQPETLLMDGITVHADCRGRGVGGRLLDEIIRYAVEHSYTAVRLDVIDTNPDAKRLYEKKGFIAVKVEHFPYLRWLLGFSGSTTMEFPVVDEP